ncbi:MAG: 50S ribosomal protein L32 [Candidatus Roizmanbacteria bacterium]|nr:50S ribosomal protein L32 [Candidatus Roizmanbacteria bacterium]
MAALPKKKGSTQRKGKRFAERKLSIPGMVVCANCKKMKRPHYRCPHCKK